MKFRPLLAALLFSAASVPTLVNSQGIFSNSAIPPTSAPQDFNFADFSYSLADMGGIQSAGSIAYPGLGRISWTPGTRPEDLFTVGMFSDYGFQNLSIDQIGLTTGQPLGNASLASFPLVQSLTVSQLAQAIPGLAQTPLNQAPPIAALAQQQGLSGGGTVGSVAPFLQGQLGQLGGKLVNYGISQIPGLKNISLSKLPGIDVAKISDIPGLSQFPLFNPLSIKDWFVPFDIGFGMSPCSVTADCHERNIDNTASGNLENMSIPCMGEKQSCAHIEVRRNGPLPTTNIRWISKEQEVSGGSGLGAAICDKEPTGRFPLGKNPKVVLEKIDELAGEIEFALYFSVFVPLDDSDSAHCFGPFPMPFFGKAKEKQWILFGPDTVPKNSPFASLAQGLGPNGGGGAGCAPQGNSSEDKSKERYGYKPQTEANSSDLVSVVTPASLNRKEELHKDTATAFNKMRQDAAKVGIDLTVVSGYRSVKEQETLWVNQVNKLGSQEKAAKISAPPGYSEHHTGYALDISAGDSVNLDASFERSPAYAWLKQNAKTYGFIQSYTGAPNQGAGNEPWHWRYEGTPQAKQAFSSANLSEAIAQQSGGCSGDYGGSCIASDGKTAAIYKGVDIAAFKTAISNVESRGSGGYQAIGSYVADDGAGNHGRALGKYQFMSYGPAKDIIRQKPGGQDFLNQVDSPNINIGQLQALTDKFFTQKEQEALMDSQIRRLADVGTAQGYKGDALLKRMAEMHTGGEGAPDGVDKKYSSSVISDYKKGDCVAGSGISIGKLKWPVSNPYITSKFGPRIHPITGEESFHNGIDLAANLNDPVRAADGGVVTFAGDAGACGYMVTVDHKNGYTTQYCHLNQIKTSVGTPVSAGQPIGLAGTTGRSTGVHIHFILRKNGEAIDATSYLRGK